MFDWIGIVSLVQLEVVPHRHFGRSRLVLKNIFLKDNHKLINIFRMNLCFSQLVYSYRFLNSIRTGLSGLNCLPYWSSTTESIIIIKNVNTIFLYLMIILMYQIVFLVPKHSLLQKLTPGKLFSSHSH